MCVSCFYFHDLHEDYFWVLFSFNIIRSRFSNQDRLEPLLAYSHKAAMSVVVFVVMMFNVILVIAIAIGGDYIELSYEITYLWSFH